MMLITNTDKIDGVMYMTSSDDRLKSLSFGELSCLIETNKALMENDSEVNPILLLSPALQTLRVMAAVGTLLHSGIFTVIAFEDVQSRTPCSIVVASMHPDYPEGKRINVAVNTLVPPCPICNNSDNRCKICGIEQHIEEAISVWNKGFYSRPTPIDSMPAPTAG